MPEHEPKPIGRPRTVMTDEAKEAIVRTVALGIWPERAAQMHGVNASTMRNERRRCPAFATALKEADAKAEASVHAKILRHMDSQWTAAAWMLERRWPQRWRKRDETTIKTGMTARQLRQAAQAIDDSIEGPPSE